MSGWFATTIVFVLVATLVAYGARNATKNALADGGRRYSKDETDPRAIAAGTRIVAVAVGVLAACTLAIASFTIVPTRSVGVVTSFGKPVGSLKNGAHLVRPWAEVEKFDASVQTLNLDGDPGKDKTPCVTVRLGNQTTACVDVSLQWNIDQSGDVVELYRKFKNFGNIEENLVRRQLRNALNEAFKAHDPLSVINDEASKPNATEGQTSVTDKSKQIESNGDLAAKAKPVLVSGVGSGIKIVSLTIPLVHYDKDTENRLKQYQQAMADTRIASQKKLTADETKQANDKLASSASVKDPGVQYQNCIDLMRELGAKDQLKNLPPAFTCPGSSTANVIIDPNKK